MVCLVAERRPKREQSITEEFVDVGAVLGELLGEITHASVQQRDRCLGAHAFAGSRKAGEVGKENAHLSALPSHADRLGMSGQLINERAGYASAKLSRDLRAFTGFPNGTCARSCGP